MILKHFQKLSLIILCTGKWKNKQYMAGTVGSSLTDGSITLVKYNDDKAQVYINKRCTQV